MNIGVLGTGIVGETIATKLVALGHQVNMGSRSATNEKARVWAEKTGDGASVGTFADAAAFGEVLFIATHGLTGLDALRSAQPADLRGKTIIDIANPLDFSKGQPATLSVCNTDSLGEQMQRAFPDAHIVKSLNTMWCGLMVNPTMLAEGAHQVFMSGNDAGAKAQTRALLQSFGWPDDRILDLGDISTARGTEMLLPLWLRVWQATGVGAFNFAIVK